MCWPFWAVSSHLSRHSLGLPDMCISLGILPDGTKVPCRKCWQCRLNRVNDWVGRSIAESKSARASHAITLTYGRDEHGNEDHPRARVLTYSDVQKYFKLLRKHGYPCRYFAVGEYGSTKGRAHWHLIVFWHDKVPPHEMNERFQHKETRNGKEIIYWPHGHSVWELPGDGCVRYFMKYIQKDADDEQSQAHFMMSKKPPLGSDYFRMEAEKYVDAGLAPQDLFYSFSDVLDRKGRKVKFYLRGKTADIFLQHFVESWARKRPGRHLPNSDLVEEWLDKQVRPLLEKQADERAFGEMLERAENSRMKGVPAWMQEVALQGLFPRSLRDEMNEWRNEHG